MLVVPSEAAVPCIGPRPVPEIERYACDLIIVVGQVGPERFALGFGSTFLEVRVAEEALALSRAPFQGFEDLLVGGDVSDISFDAYLAQRLMRIGVVADLEAGVGPLVERSAAL